MPSEAHAKEGSQKKYLLLRHLGSTSTTPTAMSRPSTRYWWWNDPKPRGGGGTIRGREPASLEKTSPDCVAGAFFFFLPPLYPGHSTQPPCVSSSSGSRMGAFVSRRGVSTRKRR